MGYMKDDFENWMKSMTRKNGTSYSKETISNYVTSLRVHAAKLSGLPLEKPDLFLIDRLDAYEDVYEAIKNNAEFEAVNESYHRIFSSALSMYRRFLQSVNSVERNRMLKQFEFWLREYNSHRLTENTIKRYIRALQKAEEWLGVTLPADILSIDNLEDFRVIQSLIKETPDYEAINHNHGHGDLSAALRAYERFLTSRQNGEDQWWPSENEYDPGISKERWIELLNTPKLFTPNSLSALAAFYDIGGAATCVMLEKKYGKSSDFYRTTCMQQASKLVDGGYCSAPNLDKNSKLWPILFVGKDADAATPGNYIWKLRDELKDALEEFGILRFLENDRAEHRFGTFDSWEILDENTAIKHCDKSFFEHNGSGVPKGICWFFNADNLDPGKTIQLKFLYNNVEYTGRIGNESSDRRRVRIFWNTELGREISKHRSEEATATFMRIAEDTYEIRFEGGEEEMPEINTQDALAGIKEYIFAKGFDYPDGMIENFYLSLKSKPFVILAGTSGTGKTRLVRLFAEAMGAEYKLVSVRPDWSDGSDLFGHTDLSGNFISGPVCDAFEAAIENRNKPVFLCMDEMNLARVEYYLSDFLSVIESRDWKNGHVVTEPIAQYAHGIPENLYIIGTVNMDETTFPFSKKVLDRANTIEFSHVDLMPKQRTSEQAQTQNLPNSFLKTEYLTLATDCIGEEEYVETICTELQAMNRLLVKANAHVGYRVRDEIVFYMLNNRKAGDLLTYEQAMDNEIMQKILPRIQGSSTAIKTLLIDLFKFCMGSGSGIDAESGNVGEHMTAAAASARYPASAEKIGYMMTRFEDDGFTSYWL